MLLESATIYKNISDEDIVLRIRAGEKSLFTELYNRYDEKLRRYAFHVCSNREIVDDIMQNVFLKVYKGLHSFNPEYKFNGWIYRITHNEAVGLAKKEAQRIWVSIDADEEGKLAVQLECPDKNPHDKLHNVDLNSDIEFALSMMKKEHADILRSFYFSDKSYKQIAIESNITIGTVGTMLLKARQELSKFEIIK